MAGPSNSFYCLPCGKFLKTAACYMKYYHFRECHSPDHALIRSVQQCRKSLDNRGIVGMVLMDLSKDFDYISHELLIAKLEAYDFENDSLNLFLTT